MDFFERWFGVSPDGGDGTLEMLYIVVAVAIVVMFVGRRWIIRHLTRSISSTADD
jgi:hypothetical protein